MNTIDTVHDACVDIIGLTQAIKQEFGASAVPRHFTGRLDPHEEEVCNRLKTIRDELIRLAAMTSPALHERVCDCAACLPER